MSVPFPSYRSRYLPAMTRAQIAALPGKERTPVVLPTGAIEQHGPHLPVAVDALMGQVWLALLHERLPADFSYYVAPPITIGKSNEHTGFPGTLSVSRHTLRAQFLCVARQVRSWGFRKLALLNTHGGNSSVLDYTAAEIRAELGLDVERLRSGVSLDLNEQEATYGFHAGEVESSWIYAVAGRYCDPAGARCEYPARVDDPGELRPECAPAVFSWVTRDLSASGILGDATVASAEKGRRWLELGADGYAEALKAFAAKEPGSP